MIDFLRNKLDMLSVEYMTTPSSLGVVYESQFLVYLECLVQAQGMDSTRVWEEFTSVCTEAAGEGNPPQSYSSYLHGRQELVDALRAFQRRFQTPRRVRFMSHTPDIISEDDRLDLFDILEG